MSLAFAKASTMSSRAAGRVLSYYRDAKTVQVEDRIPDLFVDLEVWRLEAEAHERERERAQVPCQAQWQAAMEEARRR